ncbi:MAG: HAD family phosphatase, partial [Firmicutes bacterium]|nr:HAD family phosphatase [Bacillota bacterium]
MNYKGVIFDFNGTLFFDNDKHVKAWGKISELIRGHGITLEEIHSKINGSPNKETINYFFDGKCT